MEQKIIFREMLSKIKEAADDAGNLISREEIRDLLANLPLEEEHFEMIYKYLQEQDIRIVDTKDEVQEYPEEEAQKSLSLYLEELVSLKQDIFEDEQQMMQQVLQGDQTAKLRLIESYLPVICEMAGEYDGETLPAEDLIQEGNLGLMMAMEHLEEFESAAACRAHILNSINKAMEAAIEDSQQSHKMNEGIVSRVNHLNEAVKNLEQDLEHKVSAEELSAYLEMPMEEIKDVLRMSGDQIEVEQD